MSEKMAAKLMIRESHTKILAGDSRQNAASSERSWFDKLTMITLSLSKGAP